MADPKDDAAQQRRAGWVGLRTLRQRPKVVDHTADGEPVYEVRSVRLLLRPDAGHFNRLVECAKCGREVAGAPVLDTMSLEHAANPVICKTCVQGSAIGTPRQPEKVVAEVPRVAPAVLDDGRLSTLEAQLRAVVRQVRELAEGERSTNVDAARAEEQIQAQVREAVKAELAADRDAGAGPVAALADQVRSDLGAMAEALQVQRRDLSTLVVMVDEARTEVERVDQRVADLPAVPVTRPSDAGEGLDARVAALADTVESHRREVAAVMQERVPPDLSPLVGAVEELSRARAQFDDRIDVLVRESAEQRARMDALLAAVDAGSRRLQEVEQRMQDDVDRLTGLLEGQRRGLQTMLAAASTAAPPPPVAGDPDGDDILDVLERQLLEAERRLAHRSIGAGPG